MLENIAPLRNGAVGSLPMERDNENLFEGVSICLVLLNRKHGVWAKCPSSPCRQTTASFGVKSARKIAKGSPKRCNGKRPVSGANKVLHMYGTYLQMLQYGRNLWVRRCAGEPDLLSLVPLAIYYRMQG